MQKKRKSLQLIDFIVFRKQLHILIVIFINR